MSTFDEKKRAFAKAQQELTDAVAEERKRLLDQRKEIDKQLVALSDVDGTTPRATGNRAPRGQRKSDITKALKAQPNGMTPLQIIEALGSKGNKSAEASIRNAMTNMKKAGTITSKDGIYKTTGA